MVLRVVFIKLTFRWLQTGLSDLKNTKQLKFCVWWIFYAFLKYLHFSKFFEIFEIHQYLLVKLLNALNFRSNPLYVYNVRMLYIICIYWIKYV